MKAATLPVLVTLLSGAALAQTGLPAMHVEVAVPSWILGGLILGLMTLIGVVWQQLSSRINSGFDRVREDMKTGFGQLHARVGEVKREHGKEIERLQDRLNSHIEKEPSHG